MRNLFPALVLLICIPFCVHAEDKNIATVTVHGEATTKVPPEQVTLPVMIREENIDIKVAKQKHDKKLTALIKMANDFGIEKANIKTSYTSIDPQYNYEGSSLPRLTGYEVQTTIEFTLTDIPSLGEFINKVIALGITSLGNVTYSLHDEEKVKEDTLAKAVTNAHAKAEKIAAAAGVAVDKPFTIEEGEPVINRPVRPMPMMRAGMMAAPVAVSSTPELPSGMLEIQQDVTITYQLK